jgi:hypothetical protein
MVGLSLLDLVYPGFSIDERKKTTWFAESGRMKE